MINAEFAYKYSPGSINDLSLPPQGAPHPRRARPALLGGRLRRGLPRLLLLYTAWDVIRTRGPAAGLRAAPAPGGLHDRERVVAPGPRAGAGRALLGALPAASRRGVPLLQRRAPGALDEATRATVLRPFPGPIVCDWIQPLSGERARTEIDPPLRFALTPPFEGPYAVRLRPGPDRAAVEAPGAGPGARGARGARGALGAAGHDRVALGVDVLTRLAQGLLLPERQPQLALADLLASSEKAGW